MHALSSGWAGSKRPLVLFLTLLPLTTLADQVVVRDLELTTSEDGEAQGQVATGAVPSMKMKKWPRHGDVKLAPETGSFVYRPAKDFNGDDAFALEIGRRTAKITLHVTAENDAPVVKPLELSTYEDAPAGGKLQAWDVDKGDILTFRVSAQPSRGTATVDPRTGAVSYKPARDYNGRDAFSVEVSDGAAATVAEIPVNVVAINDAPVVRAPVPACAEDTACTAAVEASDVDGDTLTWKLTAKPKHGELAFEDGRFTFTPVHDWHGDDAFSVEVSDGKLKASATVTLRVAAVNDEPVVSALSLSTNEDTPVSGAVKASDVDGDVLTWSVSKPAAHGEATVDARSGAVAYVPARDFHGDDAFEISVSDGTVAMAVPVPVSVASVNDAPVARGAAHALDEDAKLTGRCVAEDVDGDALVFKTVRQPAHGTLELAADGAFTYAPARDYHGPDSFAFQVSDGKLSSEAVVRLTVKPVNDAPVAQSIALASDEDVPAFGAVTATDVDADPLSYSVAVAPQHGEAKVDPRSGAVSYVPARDYHGEDAFTLRVSDGKLSADAPVTVALKPVDDPPAVRAMTLEAVEDTAATGMLPGSDVDGDALTFRILSQPRLGSAVLTDAATGAFRFAPSADANGDDVFAFDVTDGRTVVPGSVKVHVQAVNDAPVVAELQLSTKEDEPVEGDAHGFDVDGDALSWAVVAQPHQGKATVSGGRVRFEPARDVYGAVTFQLVVSDGKLKSQAARVTVNVQPVNDAPVALADVLQTDEDTLARGTVKATDVDGDALTYALASPAAHGTVQVLDAAKGLYSYAPAPNWFGSDAFSFTAADPSGASSTAEVKVTVAAVNDVPVAEEDHVTAPCNGRVSGRLHGFDRESPRVTYRIVSEPAHGRVKLIDAASGEFTFDVESSDGEPVTFSFVVSDGQATSEPADITVHPQGHCVASR